MYLNRAIRPPLRPWCRGAASITVILHASCVMDAGNAGSLRVERARAGDTTIVRTIAGSEWPDTAVLVEDLRIGVLDGDEAYALGRINDLAVGEDGTIFAQDTRASLLRQYDSAGRFVRNLGRVGDGPGEFRQMGGIAALRGGGVALYDLGGHRVLVFGEDGDPIGTWRLPASSTRFSGRAIAVDTANRIYVRMPVEEGDGGPPGRLGWVRLTSTGQVLDSLAEPRFGVEEGHGPLRPTAETALHPHGFYVAGHTARYSIDVYRPGAPLRIERVVDAVPVVAGERSEWEAFVAATPPPIIELRPSPGGGMTPVYGERPSIPDTKPAWSSVLVGGEGRIWVRRHVAAVRRDAGDDAADPAARESARGRVWIEPHVRDVFAPDGRYLGAVRFPERTTPYVMRGDTVWAVQLGEADEPYIVRLRIARPGASEDPASD